MPLFRLGLMNHCPEQWWDLPLWEPHGVNSIWLASPLWRIIVQDLRYHDGP